MADSNYMKRISFLDGQVLHDFHLNTMQKNIAEAIKSKTTIERYDMLLLVSPYKYYYVEPFINEDNKGPESTAELNTLSFSINSGAWVTPMLELPEETDEIYLAGSFEEHPENGAFVRFAYRREVDEPWINADIDKAIYLDDSSKKIQVKVTCEYTGTVRPIVYDFCLMWK